VSANNRFRRLPREIPKDSGAYFTGACPGLRSGVRLSACLPERYRSQSGNAQAGRNDKVVGFVSCGFGLRYQKSAALPVLRFLFFLLAISSIWPLTFSDLEGSIA
jgi:hypothetical protein